MYHKTSCSFLPLMFVTIQLQSLSKWIWFIKNIHICMLFWFLYISLSWYLLQLSLPEQCVGMMRVWSQRWSQNLQEKKNHKSPSWQSQTAAVCSSLNDPLRAVFRRIPPPPLQPKQPLILTYDILALLSREVIRTESKQKTLFFLEMLCWWPVYPNFSWSHILQVRIVWNLHLQLLPAVFIDKYCSIEFLAYNRSKRSYL